MKKDLQSRFYSHKTEFDQEKLWAKIEPLQKRKRRGLWLWFLVGGIALCSTLFFTRTSINDDLDLSQNKVTDVNSNNNVVEEINKENNKTAVGKETITDDQKTEQTVQKKTVPAEKIAPQLSQKKSPASITVKAKNQVQTIKTYRDIQSAQSNQLAVTSNQTSQSPSASKQIVTHSSIENKHMLRKHLDFLLGRTSRLLLSTPFTHSLPELVTIKSPQLKEVEEKQTLSKPASQTNLWIASYLSLPQTTTPYHSALIGNRFQLGVSQSIWKFEVGLSLSYAIKRYHFRLQESIETTLTETGVVEQITYSDFTTSENTDDYEVDAIHHYDVSHLNTIKGLSVDLRVGYQIALTKRFSLTPTFQFSLPFVQQFDGYQLVGVDLIQSKTLYAFERNNSVLNYSTQYGVTLGYELKRVYWTVQGGYLIESLPEATDQGWYTGLTLGYHLN